MKRTHRGYTLMELLIAMSVAAILAAIAYPTLQAPLLKARRIDGLHALLQLQMNQERWRANNSMYAALADLKLPELSPSSHYRLSVAHTSANGFEAIASAQGAQANDGNCKVLKLTVADGNTSYASGTDLNVDNPAAPNKRCWNQ